MIRILSESRKTLFHCNFPISKNNIEIDQFVAFGACWLEIVRSWMHIYGFNSISVET